MDAAATVERTYLRTWIALLVLAAATFGLSFLDLGPFHTPVALLIGTAKAILIVLFFMHLARERGSIPVAMIVWLLLLGILIALSMADVATRDTPLQPPVSGP
jgi:cytochrome c oxidase subunit 4